MAVIRYNFFMYRLVVVISLLATVLPLAVQAESEYVDDISYTLEQPFGGQQQVTSAAQYIQLVYQFSLGIVGIFATVLIMFGGLQWIQAAGNEQKITSAKEIIVSAVTGLVIALLSYTILVFINPQLVQQGFSLKKISVLFEDTSLMSLTKCDDGIFKGQECFDDAHEKVPCEEVWCGLKALYNGEYCRGVACASGTGGCYRGPTDPNNYTCQETLCGDWAQDCADSDYTKYTSGGTGYESQFHTCACHYYESKALPLLGFDDYFVDPEIDTLTDEEIKYKTDTFNLLCNEGKDQEYLETTIAANPSAYRYTYAASTAVLKGWDCRFNCETRTLIGNLDNSDNSAPGWSMKVYLGCFAG